MNGLTESIRILVFVVVLATYAAGLLFTWGNVNFRKYSIGHFTAGAAMILLADFILALLV